MVNSYIPGFKDLDLEHRIALIRARFPSAEQSHFDLLLKTLTAEEATKISEGVVGVYGLPFMTVPNVRVNGKDYFVPYVTEEPSNVSGPASMFKLIRQGGSLIASYTHSYSQGQLQLIGLADPEKARATILENKLQILSALNQFGAKRSINKLGGGALDLEVTTYTCKEETFLGVDVTFNVLDGSGAMYITQMMELLGPHLHDLVGGDDPNTQILSNYNEERLVHATLTVPIDILKRDKPNEKPRSGAEVAHRIVMGSRYAELEPKRAVTYNKGIMNSVDAILTATGNDTRAQEAATHSYAARTGRYLPLSTWRTEHNYLIGDLTMPATFGIVGSASRVHPQARETFSLLIGASSIPEFAELVGAMGLTQNFAALYSLGTHGISAAHDSKHLYGVVAGVDAIPQASYDRVVARMQELNIHHPNTGDALRVYEQLEREEKKIA